MYQFNYLKQLPEYQRPLASGYFIIRLFEIIIVLAIIITVFYVIQNNKINHQLNIVRKQLDQTTAQYDEFKKKYPELIGTTKLDQKIKSLSYMNQNLQKTIDRIINSELKLGFSKYLMFFAQNTPGSLWFNNIFIDLAKSNINLKGFSLDKESISELVKAIDDKSTFGGKNLSDFEIVDVSQDGSSQKLSFHLATNELVELQDLVNETLLIDEELAKNKAKEQEQKAKAELSDKEHIDDKAPVEKPEKKRKKLTEMKQYYIEENDAYGNRRNNPSRRNNRGYF